MKQTGNATQRHCYHCGKRMFSQRRTKKYCSDNCKQAAFYDRNIVSQKGSITTHTPNHSGVSGNYGGHNVNPKQDRPSRFNQISSYHDEQIAEEQHTEYARHPIMEDFEEQLAVNSDKSSTTALSKALIVSSMKEEPYVWVYSKIVADITEYLEVHHSTTEMLLYPRRYWHGAELERVLWVSHRLLSLIEELLLAGQKKRVRYRYLANIKVNCKAISHNINFRLLPSSYPFGSFIRDLTGKIISDGLKDNPTIEFGISYQRKVQLLAIRYQLAAFVPYTAMKDMDFAE